MAHLLVKYKHYHYRLAQHLLIFWNGMNWFLKQNTSRLNFNRKLHAFSSGSSWFLISRYLKGRLSKEVF